jgi:hypothetical protein
VSDVLYGRKYRVLVVDGKTTALDVSNLRCVFRIEKAVLSLANYAEIKIYNLNETTESKIIKEGARVIVEAGYDGYYSQTSDGTIYTYYASRYGKIFDGSVMQFIREREDNTDYVLTLVCLDGDSFLSNNLISLTLNAGQNKRQIINSIASKSTVKTEVGRVSPDLPTQRLPRGKVLFGEPKKYLRDIAHEANGGFYIDDGKIFVHRSTDTPGQALVVTPRNGLIGVPEQTQEGVSFKTLLDPRIGLQSMVKLDNTYIRMVKQQIGQYPSVLDQDGQYQAYRVIHSGDSRDNDWYTEVDGVGRYGTIPALLIDAAQNPF